MTRIICSAIVAKDSNFLLSGNMTEQSPDLPHFFSFFFPS
uniref:Uncharacterized protein n=1 Tax=Rhizophora mucronata TaxID=61149 RepID=A0A2P2NPN0_RHIMU